jgi:hypothetical protein
MLEQYLGGEPFPQGIISACGSLDNDFPRVAPIFGLRRR